MPYDIRRDVDGCDGFAVVVSTTGKRVGCHSTRAAAVRHQRALYANVPDARGKVQQAFTSKADAFDVAQLLLIDADFWDSYERELVETTRPLFEAIFFAGMKAAIRLPEVKPIVAGNLPEELTTKAVSEAVRTALANMIQTGRSVVENMMSTWASGIAQTTKDNILASLTRAREQSLGSPYVYDRIKADFDPARARRIAVTETTRFFGAGSVAVYRAAELPAWEWQTVEDGLVCPICSDLSGTQFRVASDFGPAHPSCRCFPKPVTDLSDREQLEREQAEPTYTDEEFDALAQYGGTLYGPVNMHLRGNARIPLSAQQQAEADQIIGRLDSAMAKSSLPTQTLYRGGPDLKLKAGDRFVDDGFTSTTTSKEIADRYATRAEGKTYVIEVPAGTKGVKVDQLFPDTYEAETLLTRGLTYDVTSVTKTTVHLKVIL